MKYTPEDDFSYYYEWANGDSLSTLFDTTATFTFLRTINEEKATYRYQPNKWSIKQVIGHITDHERIKMFRAFRLSRNEDIQLWGYDQNFLTDNSRFDELTLELLITDFYNVRKSSLSFIETLSESQLTKTGLAQQRQITLIDFIKSIVGHERHHLDIIKGRYLK
ncbi:DinB family protein [Aquimarina aquimarini]|uniref:DinB family protein n=1 Tax=Aquimarina aquimarini TaxID=1191734 RepID=UPI000D5557DD|nr:DinB family protein [Aquimarina aquimarini]